MRTSSRTQLRALFGLRWQMIRSDGVKAALVVVLVLVLWLMVLVATGASQIDVIRARTAIELAPQAFLGFALLAVIAPLTAGGGNEIIPPDQVVAFPIRPRTQFLGGLLLAPLNMVWVLQILAMIAETTLLTQGGRVLPGVVTAVAYVAAITALGQALAWSVVGLRQSRRGRQAVAYAFAGLVLALVVLIKNGYGDQALRHSPTRTVVSGVVAGARADWTRWSLTSGLLVLLAAVGLIGGAKACAWALRRPGDAQALSSSKALIRRRAHPSALRTLIAVDRASVWRAAALRRGGLVLAILPGVAAAGAQVPYRTLVVLPGLVAAGAGLLFGINAFSLDASGAVFVASLPHDPKLVARAKLLVLTETTLAAVLITVLAGSLRSPGAPRFAEVVGILASALACTAVVVSSGMASSVRRPHRADLKGPRDAIAPPGALIFASVRLTLPTVVVGLVLEGATQTGIWWLSLALAAPVLLLTTSSVRRSLTRYADPFERARIVQRVSAG